MSDSSEEKTHPASDKKLRDAREKGQVAQSRDFVSAAGACAAIAFVWVRSDAIAIDWKEALLLAAHLQSQPFESALSQLVAALAGLGARTLVPLLAAVVLAGVLASVAANGGVIVSLDPLTPKLKHLNPFEGLKKMFGMKSWVELAKSIVKTLLLGSALVVIVLGSLNTLVRVPSCGAIACVSQTLGALAKPLIGVAVGAFLAFGAADLLLQRWLFMRDQRMTMTEVKREQKDQSGNPHIRGAHQRHRQEAAAEPRLGIRQASVVIRGPGVAAGVRYMRGETNVPILVCRGRGEKAEAILAAAEALSTPLIDDPGLAKALTARVHLGAPVPARLFERTARALFMVGAV